MPKMNNNQNHICLSDKSNYIKRKCFITGQPCSHKTKIQRLREENHKKGILTTFVVMSFTGLGFSMYEMYVRELEALIKSYCSLKITKENCELTVHDPSDKKKGSSFKHKEIAKVQFMRADLEVSTGHVVCNRVCDPIQQADIVVVDVSHPNPNVFYELGLALSMGKYVLPICFSKKYYYKEPDPEGKGRDEYNIEYFPWMKELYQYFSLYCLALSAPKKYPSFSKSLECEKYTQFSFSDEKTHVAVDKIMYALLSDGVIGGEDGTDNSKDTLMLYSEKGLEDKKQFPIVLKNVKKLAEALSNSELFCGNRIMVLAQDDKLYEQDKDMPTGCPIGYNVADITKYGINKAMEQMAKDIVYFDTSEKGDSDQNDVSLPNYSDVFLAYGRSPLFMERIRQCVHHELKFFAHTIGDNNPSGSDNADKNPRDIASSEEETDAVKTDYDNNIDNLNEIKKEFGGQDYSFISLLSTLFCNLFCNNAKNANDIPELKTPTYTYLNVMISYMRYANQVFVDTHANDIVSYFWLGVCHAAGVDTARIERNYTEADKKLEENKKTFDKSMNREIQYFKSIRSVFDVAGLWCAYINANNIKDFIEQLYQVEIGIYEHHHAYIKDGEQNSEAKIGQCERYYRHEFWQRICEYPIDFVIGGTNDNTGTSRVKNIRQSIGAWDEITSMLLIRQMLHYQKNNLINLTIVPMNPQKEFSPKTTHCTVFIGDDQVNNGCKSFVESKRKLSENQNSIEYIDHSYQAGGQGQNEGGQGQNEGDQGQNKEKCEQYIQRCLNPLGNFPSDNSTSPKPFTWIQLSEACLNCLENKKASNCEPLNKINNGKSKITVYGGLILEHRCGNNKDFQNNVYIMGGNGIATYAIASIFVNPKLQTDIKKSDMRCKLLTELQQQIRKRYVDHCVSVLNGTQLQKRWKAYIREKKTRKNMLEKTLQYMAKMLSSRFLPFLSKDEALGLRRSLEYYLQELFERDMRVWRNRAAGKETEALTDEKIKKLCRIKDLQMENARKMWGSYTHNILVEFLIKKIVDCLLSPLEKAYYVEAVFAIDVEQEINKTKDYWNTIEIHGISLANLVISLPGKRQAAKLKRG